MVTVREARRMAGFSQELMADRMGMSRPTYSALETDVSRMTLGQLERFCEICGIKAASLILPINFTFVE